MHNALLVRWANGWAEVTDTTSIAANGRSEALLGIGAIQSLDEVNRVAAQQLAIFASPRTEIAADYVPSLEADLPYVGFSVSDTVLVPDLDGSTAREQVMALTVAEDENGVVTFAPELKDVLLTEQERWEQNLKKMADGTIRGQSSVATPAAQIPTPTMAAGTGGISGFEATYTLPGALTPGSSPPITTPVNCSLAKAVVTVGTVAETFRVRVYRDGVEAVNEVIAADAELTIVDASGASIADTTLWVVQVLECSVDTINVNITLRYTV